MNSNDKLKASVYLIKKAYANYLTMGGNSYSPDPVIKGLATHNLGQNTSNITTNHLADTKVMPAPAAAPAPAPAAKDPSQFFRSYMGSKFDPKSRVDRNKLKFLQSLQSEGMNLEDVKGNQAEIYKRMKGMRF